MNRQKQIQELREMEAAAELLSRKASDLFKICHSARQKLEGVSTPSTARKGQRKLEMAKACVKIVARRNSRIVHS